MSSEMLERRFAAVGARLKVAETPWRGEPRIDMRTDARGEYFDVRFAGGDRCFELEVVDVQPSDRHLLLLVRERREEQVPVRSRRAALVRRRHPRGRARRGRCGDGKGGPTACLVVAAHWGAARPKAVPGVATRLYVRQGEWFFVPAPGDWIRPRLVLRKEPLSLAAERRT